MAADICGAPCAVTSSNGTHFVCRQVTPKTQATGRLYITICKIRVESRSDNLQRHALRVPPGNVETRSGAIYCCTLFFSKNKPRPHTGRISRAAAQASSGLISRAACTVYFASRCLLVTHALCSSVRKGKAFAPLSILTLAGVSRKMFARAADTGHSN